MKLTDRYNTENLGNRSRELVFSAIEKLIDAGGCPCTCEECVMDLAAWTLNHVAPRYYTSLLAQMRPNPERERQYGVAIELALASGLKRLAEHPHHA
jgi:competence protein ComFB